MSLSSAIVGVTQVSLVGNATPGATVSETDVGPDGVTNGPFTTVANSSGTYNMGPFLLTQLGTYTGTLRDSISGQTKTITYGGTGDFSASVNTTGRTVTAGQSTTYTVTFTSIGGFSGVVTPTALDWSKVPGSSAFWSPTQVTVPSNGSVTATFTINTAASTTAGTYNNIILLGKNGAFSRGAATVSLTVNAAASLPTIGNMTTSPNPPIKGQAFNFTITGLNYNTSNAEVFFLGPGCGNSTACVVAPTRSATTLTGPAILADGYFTVQVRNGSGGTPSATWPLVVSAGATTPTIGNITTSPSSPIQGQQFSFTITGQNFNTSNAEVLFVGPGCASAAPCVVTPPTRETNRLIGPATLATGSFTVRVRNGPNGTSSGPWPLTVAASIPSTAPLRIFGFEVTQGIQDLRNSYQKFVVGRRTFVRVHVKSSISGNFYYTTAELIASRDSTVIGKVTPINTQNAIWVTAFPSRYQLNDSFLFELRPEWLNGTLDLEFRGVNYEFSCNNSGDQTCNKTRISFATVPKVELVLVRVGWYDLGGAHLPSDDEMRGVEAELRSTLPLADLVVTRSEMSFTNSGRPTMADIINRLDDMRFGCGQSRTCHRHYMAILHNAPIGIVGASRTPGYVGYAYIGNVPHLNTSHEVSHQLGAQHVQRTGSEYCFDPSYPSARRGLISEDQTDSGFFGFDINTKRIYKPNSVELMAYTYEKNEVKWISDFSSRTIFDTLRTTGGSFPAVQPDCPFPNAATEPLNTATAPSAPVQITAGSPATFISGSILGNAGKIDQLFTVASPETTTVPNSGTYAIRLERGGQTTATYLFEPSGVSEGSVATFNFSFPGDATTTRIVLVRNGVELDSRSASLNPPVVNVISPNGGEVLGGQKATIAWSATDSDNDPLNYIVQFSSDFGQTWKTIASRLTTTSTELDVPVIGATSGGLIRVLATDAFHTATDESNGHFTVQPHAPQTILLSPENAATFIGDQTMIFAGQAFDPEDGELSDSALVWSSNLDGFLGKGRSLGVNAMTLSEGMHVITLTARDQDNQLGTGNVTIQVSRTRPAMLPSLSVAPADLNFLTGTGSIETPADTIAIRNNGDGTLNWSASADQTWIHLAATSGSAPANLSVSVSPSGLAPGQYSGHVTIATSDAPNAPQSVTVTMNVVSQPIVQLSSSDNVIDEGAGSATIVLTRSGDLSAAASFDLVTSDIAGLQACTIFNGRASERCDYVTSLGTIRFAAGESSKTFTIPIINDVLVEGTETFTVTLRNPSGATFGSIASATVTITDNDSSPSTTNPIDGVEFFIRQQYADLLNRQPDATGLQNWINTLAPCPNGGFGEPPTSNCDRLHVAAGFFQSDEFLNRGYWAFRMYMVSFQQRPSYSQFIPDMAQVGGPKSPAEEETSKAAFVDAFVQRPEFLARYPGLNGQALANALTTNAGLPSFTVTGGMTNGQILRAIAERQTTLDKFLTEGTVSILYFGFQRRDPDAVGYQNNLATLNANPNNLRHMIFIFIYSTEYRQRFGPP
jgi:Calx-beta domain/Viral BACON domain